MGNNPSSFAGDNNPVESVSWNSAQSFISRLNELDSDYIYRLPTEAEWEYAARAGTDTKYSYGEFGNQLGQYAWYKGNSNNETHPIGQKLPNVWGLYDIHGNVCEWVKDWYGESYYLNSPGTDPEGPGSGSYRVIRGGGWISYGSKCSSASRFFYYPAEGINLIGLRLVRTEK